MKLNDKLKPLTKEEALLVNVKLKDTDILYHGTLAKNIESININGLCRVCDTQSYKDKIKEKNELCENAIYLTSKKEKDHTWARLEIEESGNKLAMGAIYKTTGKDIKECGCDVHPDWILSETNSKLENIILTKCKCLLPNKIKLIKDDIKWSD